MAFIDYQADKKILVMTKGHPFSRDDLAGVFEGIEGVAACMVEQPASQAFFDPILASEYSAFVFYDMPGMNFFTVDASDGKAPQYMQPPETFRQNFLDLLEQGHGFVFLHHSIASWPAWPEYAEIIGGKFLYKPDRIRAQNYPDSGYRHEVEHRVSVLVDHPVTAGVSPQFTLTDELYLGHAFSDSVIPLLSSDFDFIEANFYSAQQAVQGNMFSRQGWQHPPGHNLIGWAKHYGNSPIVYLQCGDGKDAYENQDFKRLIENAINWVSSDAAKAWARQRNESPSAASDS